MTTEIHFIYCDNCGKQLEKDIGETAEQIRVIAVEHYGWEQVEVPNGSKWDICRECLPKFKGE